MTEPIEPGAPSPFKADPETLVLRGRPQPAIRFRRGLIVGLIGMVAAALIALSWLALEPPGETRAASPAESDEPSDKARPEALADAPTSYSGVPRLGPPLPGDLGRPILEQQRSRGLDTSPESLPPAEAGEEGAAARLPQAKRQRGLADLEAARSSGVMVQLQGAAPAPGGASREVEAPAESAGPAPSASPVPPAQQHKLDFTRSPDGDVNSHPFAPSPSPWTLSAGTIIPASLITGLDSDLPGTVVAQVTENVCDSATGRTILIPQGARLIGKYDSVVAYGQRRALLVWNRLIFPDASSVGLDNMPAADSAGFAGLADRVDSHSWQLIKGVALSTLLGVGTQLGLGSGEGDLVRAIRESAGQNAASAGSQITSRNLDIQPTIRVRPGWPVRALVDRDLVLRPWRG